MDIRLGGRVVSADGELIGKVEKLALDYNTREIHEIIVKQGTFLSIDRIVEVSMIERIDDDGTVYLNISSAQAEKMPPFVREQYVVARQDELRIMPDPWAGWDPVAVVWTGTVPASGPSTQRIPAPEDNTSFFDVPGVNVGPLETESNLGEDIVLVDSGTDVVGSDGEKIGSVDEILYDDDGRITGFVVKAGFLFHHDVHVPAGWIESVTGDAVQLNVTSEQAESTDA